MTHHTLVPVRSSRPAHPDTTTPERQHTVERLFACRVEDLEPGSSTTIKGDVTIAVYRTESDRWFASDDSCTHEQWSLGSDSDLEGDEVVCPLHMARFDLATGKPLCFPATVALRMYDVVIEDGDVYVAL
jgi:nitrite reductase/ring-hydroxylating ferredoxin subunit